MKYLSQNALEWTLLLVTQQTCLSKELWLNPMSKKKCIMIDLKKNEKKMFSSYIVLLISYELFY
jgi:hypothetical protein